ncbi:MAG: DUF3667 domain-containing protein [Bacteroidales bacterium]|nr:DUF3667 domain-containing protein [Bacteroidales bacterium]
MAFKDKLKQLVSSYGQPPRYSDEELEEHQCPNCGHVFKGNFCPVCSQGAGDGHITWRWVGKSILDVWGMDSRSLPNTLLQLLWRPGHLIGDYIGGHRQICYKPVNMLFIVALVYVVIMQLIGQNVSFNTVKVEGYDQAGYFKIINFCYQWLVAHPGWAMMILTMIMILPTFIVFRFAPRRPHLSFPENIFIQIFMSTLMLVVAFTIRVSNGITIFLIPLYYYICYRQLFGYKFWGTTWRLAVCFFVWFCLAFYLIILVLVVAVRQNELENPVRASFYGAAMLTLGTAVLIAIPLSIAYFISRKTAKRRQPPSL